MISQPNLLSSRRQMNSDGVALTPPAGLATSDRTLSSLEAAPPGPPPSPQEEALVADARASLTPAQMVERKLVTLLRSNALPISHVQMLYTGLSRR